MEGKIRITGQLSFNKTPKIICLKESMLIVLGKVKMNYLKRNRKTSRKQGWRGRKRGSSLISSLNSKHPQTTGRELYCHSAANALHVEGAKSNSWTKDGQKLGKWRFMTLPNS